MPSMTLTEKILARASHRADVQPGDNIWIDVDVLMTHDVCGPGTIGVFKQHFGQDGKLWVKAPETMRFVFHGQLPPYLMAKDLILTVIGDIGCDGATYRAMEFDGEAVYALNIEERMTLCNMVIEAGGKNGVIAPDQVTLDYVNVRNAGRKPYTPVNSDKGARFSFERVYDVSKLEPVVAQPHSPDNRAYVSQIQGTKLDRAYTGSCTGGKLTDFRAAA